MTLHARLLASTAIITVLAPVLLTSSACGAGSRPCAGQCGPPFQLHVLFRPGTSQQAAIAAMNKCQDSPLLISIGQLQHPSPGPPGQWTAIIYTKSIPIRARHIPLLTCLHRSPAVVSAVWPD